MNLKQLQNSIQQELHGNLLPFWREWSLDHKNDGFVAEMSLTGQINDAAPKGLILNARLLWTFSALYRALKDNRDLVLANRAYHYLDCYFLDQKHGGYRWHVDQSGNCVDSSKKIYGQAFCIYALSEYYQATGREDASRAAFELFELIEQHARDSIYGGYIEVLAEDWSAAGDLRLSDKDMDVAKSMNNHLHLLEAYANLFRTSQDRKVAGRLRELLNIFGSKMLSSSWHFDLFFDNDWKIRSDSYTYGHDIEGAWLLCDAAEALGDSDLIRRTSEWAFAIAQSVSAEAIDSEGGICYEGREGKAINSGREWWPQAEAILGFWRAYTITHDEKYANIAAGVWNFIQKRMIDRQHGEWFWRVFADGSIDEKEPKISEWKDPYHGVRMCLTMLAALEKEKSEKEQ